MAWVCRRLHHRLHLSNPIVSSPHFSRRFFSTESQPEGEPLADSQSPTSSSSAPPSPSKFNSQRRFVETVLEDGIDVGIYKAVIVGQIGQTPLEKKNKNGSSVILTSVGTGGMRNERVPFANEEPRDYADRSAVQWHRVAVYHPSLGQVLISGGLPGSLVYLEGNLETRIFSDPITGLVRRIREIAVRRNGRIVFLGGGNDYKPSDAEIRGVGYY